MFRAIRLGIICAAVALLAITVGELNVRAPSGTSAVKAIVTIHTAQVQYYSSYNRFAGSMQELGPPASGAEGPSAAGLIERDLASGDKGGYKFTLTATPTGYAISAVPDHSVISGSKTYFSDQSMGIHVHNGQEPATVNDPLLSGGRSTLWDPHPGRRLE